MGSGRGSGSRRDSGVSWTDRAMPEQLGSGREVEIGDCRERRGGGERGGSAGDDERGSGRTKVQPMVGFRSVWRVRSSLSLPSHVTFSRELRVVTVVVVARVFSNTHDSIYTPCQRQPHGPLPKGRASVAVALVCLD